MTGIRRRSFALSALVAITAIGLGLFSDGLHSASDPLGLKMATPTTVFAVAHAANDAGEHVDPETASETVLCLACLQQLERQTDLLAPAGQVTTPAPARAPNTDRRSATSTNPLLIFSSRAPPGA